jgi:(heptosyl)LPS beta-1,4-glucosyltransferase
LTPITAVIITLNEEENLARCLASLDWVNEIVVVDSGSTDATLDIARAANARVIPSEWKGYAATKQIGVDAASNDWILWIDSDEVISHELRDEIKAIDEAALYDAYSFPRKTFFLGTWVRHCGWYPGRIKRLFNRRYVKIGGQIVHEGLEMERPARVGQLRSDLLHYSYTSVGQFFQKMNRYGIEGAQELQRSGRRYNALGLIFNPPAAFLKAYLIKLGFLDGTIGFIISVGSAYATFIKYTNFYFLDRDAAATTTRSHESVRT